jgi:hypothetical protein
VFAGSKQQYVCEESIWLEKGGERCEFPGFLCNDCIRRKKLLSTLLGSQPRKIYSLKIEKSKIHLIKMLKITVNICRHHHDSVYSTG